jgi:hypothetical protein
MSDDEKQIIPHLIDDVAAVVQVLLRLLLRLDAPDELLQQGLTIDNVIRPFLFVQLTTRRVRPCS